MYHKCITKLPLPMEEAVKEKYFHNQKGQCVITTRLRAEFLPCVTESR